MTLLVQLYPGDAMAALAQVNMLGRIEATSNDLLSHAWHNHYVRVMRGAEALCHSADVIRAYTSGAESVAS